MSDFVTLTCPSCGGKLQITNDIDRFACAHCGAEHAVRRGGGLVSLAPVVAEIRHVRSGVDRTASEMAIPRLTSELAQLERIRSSIITDYSRIKLEAEARHPPETQRWGCGLILAGLALAAFAAFGLYEYDASAVIVLVSVGLAVILWIWPWTSPKTEALIQREMLEEQARRPRLSA